jgi:hypothetical protein
VILGALLPQPVDRQSVRSNTAAFMSAENPIENPRGLQSAGTGRDSWHQSSTGEITFAGYETPMTQVVDSLDILETTQPPILGSTESDKRPSLSHLSEIRQALTKVPSALRVALSQYGYRIVALPDMSKLFPEKALPQSRRLPATEMLTTNAILERYKAYQYDHWWFTHSAHDAECPKTIFLPEMAWEAEAWRQTQHGETPYTLADLPPIPQKVPVDGFSIKPFRMSEAPSARLLVLHEVGHAVDDYMGQALPGRCISHSAACRVAFANDRAMLRNHRDLLESLNLPISLNLDALDSAIPDTVREELFAELLARLLDDSSDIGRSRSLKNAFPELTDWIVQTVVTPWRAGPVAPMTVSRVKHARRKA